MKVEIKKCSVSSLWYKDRIGEIFEVGELSLKAYGWAYKTKILGADFTIYKEDCKVCEEPRKCKNCIHYRICAILLGVTRSLNIYIGVPQDVHRGIIEIMGNNCTEYREVSDGVST